MVFNSCVKFAMFPHCYRSSYCVFDCTGNGELSINIFFLMLFKVVSFSETKTKSYSKNTTQSNKVDVSNNAEIWLKRLAALPIVMEQENQSLYKRTKAQFEWWSSKTSILFYRSYLSSIESKKTVIDSATMSQPNCLFHGLWKTSLTASSMLMSI